jgi:hypothetical protein
MNLMMIATMTSMASNPQKGLVSVLRRHLVRLMRGRLPPPTDRNCAVDASKRRSCRLSSCLLNVSRRATCRGRFA